MKLFFLLNYLWNTKRTEDMEHASNTVGKSLGIQCIPIVGNLFGNFCSSRIFMKSDLGLKSTGILHHSTLDIPNPRNTW